MSKSQESFTFTVGKLDAGMAILIGERAHLIEFPSILLPPGVGSGSIVNIAVHRNVAEEERQKLEFWQLQEEIAKTFGEVTPRNPELKLRNVTQTSVTLEWPALELATAKIRSLDLYKNGQRFASIPSPLRDTSTRLSGLEVDKEYSFQLVLRTTAGTYPSNLLKTRTHTISETSGICVCFGNVQDPVLLEHAKAALEEMHGKWSEKIQIDTTHFVCTTAAPATNPSQSSTNLANAEGVEYQRASQLSIPIVLPHWLLACHAEKKMVPIANYYLNVTPPPALPNSNITRRQSLQNPPGQPAVPAANYRQSLPPSATTGSISPKSPKSSASTFVNQAEEDEHDIAEHPASPPKPRHRNGTMNKDFKFPPGTPTSPPVPVPSSSNAPKPGGASEGETNSSGYDVTPPEVPPPPPMEKERVQQLRDDGDDGEDDVGPTVEVDLS
ncbi:hypothetical protein BU17DRAFT_46308 [Hysterangium stoloniferum]|nr:hypothetical protein BU17DRAFT_46308 [Hysterangium stoloniferum]